MDRLERQNYNREQYQKNREKILEQAKLRHSMKVKRTNRVPVFKKSTKRVQSRGSRQVGIGLCTSIEVVAIALLVAVMTYFLFSEAAKFYLSFDRQSGGAYLKAGVLEGALLFFSWAKVRTTGLKWLHISMIALIYFYGVWVLSGSILNNVLRDDGGITIIQTEIRELEEEISKKEVMREHYFKTDRVRLTRRIDWSIDTMRNELAKLRGTISQMPHREVVWNAFFALVVFRMIIMVSNILCVRYLRELLAPISPPTAQVGS